jgi:hypothetical protein
MRRLAAGPPVTPVRDFSVGLFLTTSCLDGALPYALTSPLATRSGAIDAVFGAFDPSLYRPWSGRFVRDTSVAEGCRLFPPQATARAPIGPLPKVPTLLLSGRSDVRTPTEQAEQVQRAIPGSTLVTVAGTGHDVIDSDLTGCAETALRRFVAGKAVGRPCRGKTNALPVLARPPRTLADVPAAPGVSGTRGRVLRAAVLTAQEAAFAAAESVYAGFSPSSGGLRGGRMSGDDAFAGTLTLRNYAYVPGVRLSGDLEVLGNALRGRLQVRGTVNGTLELTSRNRARGVLGGQSVRFAPASARGAASATGGLEIPALPRGALQAPGLRLSGPARSALR